jgi:3'-5' exoribonuclease
VSSGHHFIFVTRMYVRDFQDGATIDQALLVRSVAMRRRSDGEEFLKLTLGDRTGSVSAILWEGLGPARDAARPGAVIAVRGHFSHHERFGAQLTVDSVRPAGPHEYDDADLVDGPSRSADQMETDLRGLIATVQNPHLRHLLSVMLGEDSPTWQRYREAPAAKRYHQAYRHGLLEHCLTVAQAVSAISATFPGLDRDVAVAGALLHDIGKLDAYEFQGEAIEMSDSGRLFGEIPLGYYRVRRAIESTEGFPQDTAGALLHIILSHHGSLEHGSPVIPCTREATLVHMIDNLGGRLGSFDRLEKALPDGEQWSVFDKGIGGGAFFAGAPPAEAADAAERRAA